MFCPLDDDTLFPLQTDATRATLKRLREHPHAPIYNWRTGERLTAVGLENVREYARRLNAGPRGHRPGELPPWLVEFVRYCRREVPFHRTRADWTDDFFALPPMTRETIRRRPWDLVPDGLPIDDDLIVYTTSGTTGQRLKIISHPEVPARYLPAIQYALARVGVTIEGGPGRVSIVHVSAQQKTNVMSSVSSYLGGAGFAKVNLLPHDWRDSADAAKFLDDCAAEVYTGDPFAFARLKQLPLNTRPKAIVSSATALLPGLRAALQSHFACPVIDLYSMNESGPIAFGAFPIRNRQSAIRNLEVLPHDLYVETLAPDGRPCPPGTRGEITLTGGNNPYLPLLRYRTGDFAAMDFSTGAPRLVDFQGRSPTVFRTPAGQRLNAIDVTAALADLPLTYFTLHQDADGSLDFFANCDDDVLDDATRKLEALFGPGAAVRSAQAAGNAPLAGKAVQYTADPAAG
jgi:phenylacetate-CoA ligase